MESTLGEDAGKSVETTKNKAVGGLARTDSSSARNPVGKTLSNSIIHYREIIHERKINLMD